jgi:hypothetical protein
MAFVWFFAKLKGEKDARNVHKPHPIDLQNYESTKVISPRCKALGASNFKWVDSSGYIPSKLHVQMN